MIAQFQTWQFFFENQIYWHIGIPICDLGMPEIFEVDYHLEVDRRFGCLPK